MKMTLDEKLEDILRGLAKKIVLATISMTEKGELGKKKEKLLDKAFENTLKQIKAVCKKEFAPEIKKK